MRVKLPSLTLDPEGARRAEGVDINKHENERLKAAEQRLIATGSLVNVAEQRLKDTQSQGDDSPATPLRLTAAKPLPAHPLIRSPLTLIWTKTKTAILLMI